MQIDTRMTAHRPSMDPKRTKNGTMDIARSADRRFAFDWPVFGNTDEIGIDVGTDETGSREPETQLLRFRPHVQVWRYGGVARRPMPPSSDSSSGSGAFRFRLAFFGSMLHMGPPLACGRFGQIWLILVNVGSS